MNRFSLPDLAAVRPIHSASPAATLRIPTPVGPLEMDVEGDPQSDELTLVARGTLMLPSGALDVELRDLATVDLAARTVVSNRQRLRRSMRLSQGRWMALRLIGVLMPRLERVVFAEPGALVTYAEQRRPLLVEAEIARWQERITTLRAASLLDAERPQGLFRIS